ncbi:MAG: hypothetical protein EBU49_01490 [Proteobacteria bacterium]|nr:hypothetical protein [Pseudomonadota bacterium]
MKSQLRQIAASWLVLAGFFLSESLALAVNVSQHQVSGLQVNGAVRTNIHWLQNYLGFEFPVYLSEIDIQRIRQKLITTDVFVDVQVRVDHSNSMLIVDLDEKWTTIPVIRGAYGGGTPLLVAGVYDMHAYGRLLTLGVETKKYGSAPPGFTLWAKLPRAAQGKGSSGIEVWRDFRRRNYYDPAGEMTGKLGFDSAYLRFYHLVPLFPEADPLTPEILQAGLELLSRRDRKPLVEEKSAPDLNLPENENAWEHRVLASFVFDNLSVEDQQLEGHRLTAKSGLSKSEGVVTPGLSNYSEAEGFSFHRPSSDVNIVLHAYLQAAGSPTISNAFHLGGFDSIRGFPDGIRYGAFAAYSNFEVRREAWTSKWLKVAAVAFVDAGVAGKDFKDASEDLFRSAGAGVRLSIPKVHRLVFRLDYAWGKSNDISTSGISLGLNQFFQPYKPL